MKIKKGSILLIAILCGICAVLPVFAGDSRVYEFENLMIMTEVLSDGAMQVCEERTVHFQKGEFHGLYQWIYTDKGIEITDLVVEENGQAYQFNPGSTYGPAGTYLIKKEKDRVYIDWSFEAKAPERRTFILKYKVLNAVKVYTDVAELYYQFVGAEWEKPVQSVSVQLRLPAGAQTEEIRAWGHGPLHGDVRIENARNVVWNIAPLPEKTFMEGRVTFPPQLVPKIKKSGQMTERLPQILAEETKWAQQANSQRISGLLHVFGAVLIFLAALAFALYLQFRYGREFKSEFNGDYYRELPVTFPPAAAGFLWRFGKTEVSDLMATILDLARRGLLRIEEYEYEKGLVFKSKRKDYTLLKNREKYVQEKGGLKPYEVLLMNFLFVHVSKSDKVSFREIEEFTERDPRYFYNNFWEKWQTLLKEDADRLGFFDQEATSACWIRTGLGAGLLALMAVYFYFRGWVVLLVSAIAGIVLLVVSAMFIRRRSPQGAEDFAKLKAFRRFLLDFSNMDKSEIPDLILWEHFLVYAVPFGIAEKVMQKLNLVFPNLEEDDYRFGQDWYYLKQDSQLISEDTGLSKGFSSLLGSINGFGLEIEKAIKTVQKASSGEGSGGGFSGGGGGGAGGGGGGVR